MKREATLEKKLVDKVEAVGGLCWKFTSPNTPGVPDRVCIMPDGAVVFVEMKAEFGRLSNIQKYRREQLLERKADIRVVKGKEALQEFIKEVQQRYAV